MTVNFYVEASIETPENPRAALGHACIQNDFVQAILREHIHSLCLHTWIGNMG